jgi:hypothetical protein
MERPNGVLSPPSAVAPPPESPDLRVSKESPDLRVSKESPEYLELLACRLSPGMKHAQMPH